MRLIETDNFFISEYSSITGNRVIIYFQKFELRPREVSFDCIHKAIDYLFNRNDIPLEDTLKLIKYKNEGGHE